MSITSPEEARAIGLATLQRDFESGSIVDPSCTAKAVVLAPNETVVTQEYLARVNALLNVVCVACQGTIEFDDEVPNKQWNEVCNETEDLLGRFDK